MLSQTTEGRGWIAQFDEADRETAGLLLDSIILVDQGEFEGKLEAVLDKFIAENGEKVALYAALERPTISDPLSPGRRIIDRTKKFFPPYSTPDNLSREPEPHASPGDVGSEGDLSHFCRDFTRKYSAVLTHPGLETLRANKIDYIVCIDDVVGSGNRMKEFVLWLREDQTIKSWMSFGFIKFAVVSYAITDIGRRTLEGLKILNSINSCRSLTFGRSIWKKEEELNIISLCKRYSRRNRLKYPLGYKKAFSLILFPNNCPNTNPQILWKGSGTWSPLIQGMRRPVDLIRRGEGGEKQRQDRLLRILGMTTLTKPSLFRRLAPESRSLISFLVCINMKKRSDEVLSEMLGLPFLAVHRLHDKAIDLGWIEPNRYITSTGRKALRAAKRNKCDRQYSLEVNNEFYYPENLRSPAS